MAKKTNKTSHVLNLITNGTTSEQEMNPEATAVLAPEPAVEGPVTRPERTSAGETVLEEEAVGEHAAALRENAAALRESAAAIREAVDLGEEGGLSLKAQTSPKEELPLQTETVLQEAETSQEEDAKVRPVKEPKIRPVLPGDKKVIVVNEAGENDKISGEILNQLTSYVEEEERTRRKSCHMVNVMEEILNHVDLETHMRAYDVCLCSRCRVDVKALTLTSLPAKYVVVDENSVAPIIGYYESRFRVRILTEIIKACMTVKKAPRHERLNSPGWAEA